MSFGFAWGGSGGGEKAIIKCHLAPVACSPLPFSPTPTGIVRIFRISTVNFPFVSMWLIFGACGSFLAICYDYLKYNGSHYSFGITCPPLAFWRLPNNLEVMTFHCFLFVCAPLFPLQAPPPMPQPQPLPPTSCISCLITKLACLRSNAEQSSPIYSLSNYMRTTPGSANYLFGH